MGNTYSHNCMVHRDMILKFGRLFDLAKYISAYKVRQGATSPALNFGISSISP